MAEDTPSTGTHEPGSETFGSENWIP
ncbi:PaaI family thioesterase, partial [Nocardia cyriacigeorgica]